MQNKFIKIPFIVRSLPLFCAMLIAGCSPPVQSLNADFTEQMETGRALWSNAQFSVENDPRAALPVLLDARKAFLRAAMISPGNIQAAQQIAGVSGQIRCVEQAVKAQEKAEEDLQAKLEAAIEELKILTQREVALSRKSQELLKKRPPATPEESAEAATSGHTEQNEVGEGTGKVLEAIKTVQSVIQKMLMAAYGDNEKPPPTEMDQAADKLGSAREPQESVLVNLSPDAVNWPQAHSALLTASRRMQEALALLIDQNKGSNPDQESQESDQSNWDFDDQADWSEADKPSNISMPMSSQSFKTALENQALPVPNYTAEEILMEEAANMEQRAQQKAGRAGANVEKNW